MAQKTRKSSTKSSRPLVSAVISGAIVLLMESPGVAEEWTGKVKLPTSPSEPVIFQAERGADQSIASISMIYNNASFAFERINLTENELTFSWMLSDPALPLDCELTREPDESFDGSCTHEESNTALSMNIDSIRMAEPAAARIEGETPDENEVDDRDPGESDDNE